MGEGRVYVPVTAAVLRQVRKDGGFRPPLHGHAVTEDLVAELGGDQEQLEYAAMSAAALDALTLLRPEDRPRRLVAALDAGAWTASTGPEAASSEVQVTVAVPFRRLAAVHADSDDAAPDVASAVRSLGAADSEGGADSDGDVAVERCLDHELGWYAVQELDVLLGDPDDGPDDGPDDDPDDGPDDDPDAD